MGEAHGATVLAAGAIVMLAIFVKATCRRLRVPALVGYLLLGLAGAMANHRWSLFDEQAMAVFDLLAAIGVICLLFRVGLESDKPALIDQLGTAIRVWIGNIGLSALAGYLTARYLLDFALVPSLFIAVALSATSLGVSVEVWREAGALRTRAASLLIDVAEMDDISGIALLAILLAIAPLLHDGDGSSVLPAIGATGALFAVKAVAFGGFCIAFAKYLEKPITDFFRRVEPAPDPMLLVIATGVVIAAVADWLGFTLAIGALFAGLIFSRDPEGIKEEASFAAIYDLFTPFFFIYIGLTLDIAALGLGLGVGITLLAAAVFGKVIGSAVPILRSSGLAGACLIGVSMVPRAEIAMVIMAEGRRLGDWAVPPEVFAGLVGVSLVTCLITPLLVRTLLERWPRDDEKPSGSIR